MKYDFSTIASNLVRWQESQSESKAKKLSNKLSIINKLASFPREYPYSFYPPLAVIIATLIVNSFSHIPLHKINQLEPLHQAYENNVNSKRRLSKGIKELGNNLDVHKGYFEKSAPIYLFAYELQKIVPKDLQLSSYNIDRNSFKINARSYNLAPINKLISLMSTSTVIDFSTIRLKRISRNNNFSINTGSEISKGSMILFEISGLLKEINITEKLQLHLDSGSYGLHKKLNRVIQLNKKIKGMDKK